MTLSCLQFKILENSMRVLILGGNGFIGSNLAEYLIEMGMEVYSFDYAPPAKRNADVHYLKGDFFDDEILKGVVAGKDVVYHAVSTITPGNSNERYFQGYSKDFLQTVKLCEYVEEMKGKLIFLSSGGTVYGNQAQFPIKEEFTPHPINHYGNLKLCIENTMLTFAYQKGMKVTIARISNPYGPGQDSSKGVGFVDAAIRSAISGRALEVWGDGNNIRDYIYIKDVCKMLASLIECDEMSGQVVNISSGMGISMNKIIEIVKRNESTLKVVYKKARCVDAKAIVLDNSKIMGIFGEKLVGIEEGIGIYYQILKKYFKEYSAGINS